MSLSPTTQARRQGIDTWRWLRPTDSLGTTNVSLGLLLVGLILVAVSAITAGAVPLPLFDWLLGGAALSPLEVTVMTELRLPRVVLAGAVGATLAVSGAVLQGLFRNPLAEPQLIGVSSGAALGAIAMIVLGSRLNLPEAIQPYSIPVAATVGALLVTMCLYAVAARRGRADMATLLLVGVAINACAGVGMGLFTWFANDGELRSLTFWSMGSFGGAQWATVAPAITLMLLGFALLLPVGGALDRLQLGEQQAFRLGVSVPAIKRRIVLASAIGVGAAVAVSGTIGFLGLIVPHLVRMLFGVHHRILIAGSAVLGAALAVLADLLARTLVLPAEMPVGLVTAAIGAPFFLWLIIRRHG